MTATLRWERTPFHHAPGRIWRLYADPDTLAALGGAPCFSHSKPGQIAYVLRDGGLWRGEAELTPYETHRTPSRRSEETAKDDAVAAVLQHLLETQP